MKKRISNGFKIVQDLIKLSWIPEILRSINYGNHRYSDILDSIPYMSHTELNRKLAVLVDKKVIHKDLDDQTGSYFLLDFGRDLVHIFNHLEELEEKHVSYSK